MAEIVEWMEEGALMTVINIDIHVASNSAFRQRIGVVLARWLASLLRWLPWVHVQVTATLPASSITGNLMDWELSPASEWLRTPMVEKVMFVDSEGNEVKDSKPEEQTASVMRLVCPRNYRLASISCGPLSTGVDVRSCPSDR